MSRKLSAASNGLVMPSVRLSSIMILMALLMAASLTLAWNTVQNSRVLALDGQNDGRPVGSSIKGYWTSAPAGYLLEDGSCVSRTTYANLFSVMGLTFGSCDGGNGFILPDSRSTVTVAKWTGTSEFDSLGEYGGEKYHTLTESEMPAHDHDFSGHMITWGNSAGTVWFRESDNDANRIIAIGGAAAAPNGMYVNNGANGWSDTYHTGGGGAHNNLQPYIVVLRAIKY